jgi:hypothetical protein
LATDVAWQGVGEICKPPVPTTGLVSDHPIPAS